MRPIRIALLLAAGCLALPVAAEGPSSAAPATIALGRPAVSIATKPL